jgi:hypothetical protein
LHKFYGMKYLLVSLFLFFGGVAHSQKATVEGNVIDSKSGQPLTGVSVVVVETKQGTSTDIKGHYVLVINNKQKVSLVFSYGGVTQQINEVELMANGLVTQNVSFIQKDKTEEGVVVRATTTSRKETAAAIIAFQKNTNTVASVISAEAIKRSPDRNTGEILKRTPGTSLQDGRFIVIRGLADRYNQAMLNGILLTSTEPDRKTFSFDLIPSQVIDNIIINKAFVPELPGEWSGGLIQVNTKDIPAKNFFNIQIGTGFNTQTIGRNFLKEDLGGKTDWLGLDDGTRGLPSNYIGKSNFDTIGITGVDGGKTAIAKQMRNSWTPKTINAPLNANLQLNGGFIGKLFGKKVGGSLGVAYNRSNKYQDLININNNIDSAGRFGILSSFDDNKFVQETNLGGMASLSVQLNALNKISGKVLLNVNGVSSVLEREGFDEERQGSLLKGFDFTFKQNTFFTGQLNGEHGLRKNLKLKWYGAFNILDGYVPDQRRLLYEQTAPGKKYEAIISNTLSQKSGSRIFQSLSDYIYTGGGDVSFNFNALKNKHVLKAGYMIQVKDRLYDAQLFSIFLPKDNLALKQLPSSEIFAPQNFGDGNGTLFGFNAIKNKNFRYIANTILNAGFVQLQNQFGKKLSVVWGLRVENFDQLIGSVKKYDDRHFVTNQTDFLPGLNVTYKLNNKTNIRLSASQTVIRPELRELASLNLYDFELNASVNGDPKLKRTKIINTDLRYELYPRAGEVFSAGVFYKNFSNPIEQYFNEDGGGSFSFVNPSSAYSVGLELELRKKMDAISALKNFTFLTNLALIKSEVKDNKLILKRPLQGQSNYMINAGILYDIEKLGLNVTTLFNMIGRRIYVVGGTGGFSGSPNVWEKPRPLLDFQIAKKLLKNKAEVKLNITDIINAKQIFYQNNTTNKNFEYNSTTDALRFQRINGSTVGVTINYTL